MLDHARCATVLVGILASLHTAADASAQVFGSFVLVEDNAALTQFTQGGLELVVADIYEFTVTNRSTYDLTSFSLDFRGDFLNGLGLTTASSDDLPELIGERFADTFFAGNGVATPQTVGAVVDNNTQLSAEAIAVLPLAPDRIPWVPANSTSPIAVFAVPPNASPLTLSSNLALGRTVVGGFAVDVITEEDLQPGFFPNASERAEFSRVIDLPLDDVYDLRLFEEVDAQVNIGPGGIVDRVKLGLFDRPSAGSAELNAGGGRVSFLDIGSGSTANISGGSVNSVRAFDGSEIHLFVESAEIGGARVDLAPGETITIDQRDGAELRATLADGELFRIFLAPVGEPTQSLTSSGQLDEGAVLTLTRPLAAPVPEPASIAALLGLVLFHRRRRPSSALGNAAP